MSRTPEKVFRIGAVSASVFLNHVEEKRRPVYSVNLQRRYRDGEEWKSSSAFGLAELPQAITALNLAMDYVVGQEADSSSAEAANG
jgi:hypothetical protein